jgi:hypothetical protein
MLEARLSVTMLVSKLDTRKSKLDFDRITNFNGRTPIRFGKLTTSELRHQ